MHNSSSVLVLIPAKYIYDGSTTAIYNQWGMVFTFVVWCQYAEWWIWSEENMHAIQQVSLYNVKVSGWCAVIVWQIIGPILFQQTMNSGWYVSIILNHFQPTASWKKINIGYFQQDNATVHTADKRDNGYHIQDVFKHSNQQRALSVADSLIWLLGNFLVKSV